MRRLEREHNPEKRRGRELLTVRNPRVDMALDGLAIDEQHIAETRRFGNAVVASVNRWNAGREVNSLADRRLDKVSAARLLRIRLASLNGGDE